jgi:hypothetical protein
MVHLMTQFNNYKLIPVAARSKGVGLRPLACWDCGLESRREALVSISCECCVLSGRGLYKGPISRPEEFYRLCLSVSK